MGCASIAFAQGEQGESAEEAPADEPSRGLDSEPADADETEATRDTAPEVVEEAVEEVAEPPTPDEPSEVDDEPELFDLALEGDAIEDFDLEALLREPVVTASGGEAEERVMASANVTVVTRDEIALRGWRSVAEVLSNQPGLYVVDDLVVPSVGVRGVTGGLRAGTRIVRVMIDGTPVNFRPDLTAFLGLELVPIEAVDRIEIAQGPLSALYGANAFLATVNIITLAPGSEPRTEIAGRLTTIRSNVGGGFSAMTSQGNENFGVLLALSADHLDRSGLQITRTFDAQDASLDRYAALLGGTTRDDISTPQSAYMRLFINRPDRPWGRLTIHGGVQRLDSMAELQVNSAMSHDSRVAIDNYWVAVRHEQRWNEHLAHTAEIAFATGRPTRDMSLALPNNPNATYRPQFGYQALNLSGALTWTPLGRQLSFRLGIDAEIDFEDVLFYRQTLNTAVGDREPGHTIDLIDPSTLRQQTLTDVGFALQVSSYPSPSLPGLKLTGDLRVDVINYGTADIPTQLSWRAGAVYQWSPSVTTKLVGGQAFQTPSPVLMFAQGGYGVANNVIGNANVVSIGVPPLRPQRVTGAEAITTLEAFRALHVDFGVFLQNIDDRIVFNQLATDFVAVNEDPVTSLGTLLTLRLRVDRFGAYATFTGQAQIRSDGFSWRPPPQYPNVFGTVGANVDVPEARLRINANVRWAGERGATQSNQLLNDGVFYTLDPYALVDLSVSTANLRIFADFETRLTVAVRNLFDTRYSEPGFAGFDIPNLGRSIWVELRQVF